jgi:hypothetical protein
MLCPFCGEFSRRTSQGGVEKLECRAARFSVRKDKKVSAGRQFPAAFLAS